MTTQNNISSEQNDPFDGIKENRENKPPAYFNALYFGLIIWGIIFMGYYLLSGWSSHSEFQEKMQAHQTQTGQGNR
ncbi:MAG: hypothetical protein HGA96_06555 [Desulfobulbaceae bacterium]|nr:hypothetical protein [Desulfobulbaceae bacterium]